jgi:hypothetical protein
VLTDELVSEAFRLLNEMNYRNNVVKHNLEVLRAKLSHEIISEKLSPLIINMFTKVLNGEVSS